MNDILRFLQNRNSAPKLCAPAPSDEQLQEIFTAALRAPDHGWIRPWRFIVISGDRRAAFGETLKSALLQRNPQADSAAQEKTLNAPLRAPLLVVVVARLSDHPKAPHSEQRLSSGCTAHAILLASEALGFAGIWRTGDAAFDRIVMTELGLTAEEEITGFLYIGSREGEPKKIPSLATEDFVSHW